MVMAELQHQNYDISGLRGKYRNEFAKPDSPELGFVFTVCDKARGEICQAWPGQPMAAHWRANEPHAFQGPGEEARWLIRELENRIRLFVSLPLASPDRLTRQAKLDQIGGTSLTHERN